MTDRKKILIVEDELMTARLLQMELQEMGLDVPKPVAKGEEAVRIALEENLALILMDIRLAGGMDGIEAAQEIQARRKMPILFMTGYDLDYIKERAKNIETLGFLPKPVDIEELRRIIEKYL